MLENRQNFRDSPKNCEKSDIRRGGGCITIWTEVGMSIDDAECCSRRCRCDHGGRRHIFPWRKPTAIDVALIYIALSLGEWNDAYPASTPLFSCSSRPRMSAALKRRRGLLVWGHFKVSFVNSPNFLAGSTLRLPWRGGQCRARTVVSAFSCRH